MEESDAVHQKKEIESLDEALKHFDSSSESLGKVKQQNPIQSDGTFDAATKFCDEMDDRNERSSVPGRSEGRSSKLQSYLDVNALTEKSSNGEHKKIRREDIQKENSPAETQKEESVTFIRSERMEYGSQFDEGSSYSDEEIQVLEIPSNKTESSSGETRNDGEKQSSYNEGNSCSDEEIRELEIPLYNTESSGEGKANDLKKQSSYDEGNSYSDEEIRELEIPSCNTESSSEGKAKDENKHVSDEEGNIYSNEKTQKLEIPAYYSEPSSEGRAKDENKLFSPTPKDDYELCLKPMKNTTDSQSSDLSEPWKSTKEPLGNHWEAHSSKTQKKIHDIQAHCGHDQDNAMLYETFDSIPQNSVDVKENVNDVEKELNSLSRQHETPSFETDKKVYDFQQRKNSEEKQETGAIRKNTIKKKFHEENTYESENKNRILLPGCLAKFKPRNIINQSETPNYSVSCFSQPSSNDIKTLEDALKYFDLTPRLEAIEKSLEEVRRHKKSKEDHESFLKKFDNELQKLSLKHHPDRIRNRGGSERELEEATKLQTALNTTRTVLSFLSKMFLEDLDIDYKYGFFSKLNISVLGNEAEVEKHIYDVLFKMCFISEIKQQHITGEIRKLLIDGQNCLKCFVEGSQHDFEKHCASAMNRLKKCTRWYEKLIDEFEEVEEDWKRTENEKVASHLRMMKREHESQLEALQLLDQVATQSLKKPLEVFIRAEPLDGYFVLPVVLYVNAILMCHAMTQPKRKSILLQANKYFPFTTEGMFTIDSTQSQSSNELRLDDRSLFTEAYYLASYYSGNRRHKTAAKEVMQKLGTDRCIESAFLLYAAKIRGNLENRFKSENYSTSTVVRRGLKTCERTVAAFHEERMELERGISNFKRESQEIKNESDRMKKENREFTQGIQERLEQNRRLLEELSKCVES